MASIFDTISEKVLEPISGAGKAAFRGLEQAIATPLRLGVKLLGGRPEMIKTPTETFRFLQPITPMEKAGAETIGAKVAEFALGSIPSVLAGAAAGKLIGGGIRALGGLKLGPAIRGAKVPSALTRITESSILRGLMRSSLGKFSRRGTARAVRFLEQRGPTIARGAAEVAERFGGAAGLTTGVATGLVPTGGGRPTPSGATPGVSAPGGQQNVPPGSTSTNVPREFITPTGERVRVPITDVTQTTTPGTSEFFIPPAVTAPGGQVFGAESAGGISIPPATTAPGGGVSGRGATMGALSAIGGAGISPVPEEQEEREKRGIRTEGLGAATPELPPVPLPQGFSEKFQSIIEKAPTAQDILDLGEFTIERIKEMNLAPQTKEDLFQVVNEGVVKAFVQKSMAEPIPAVPQEDTPEQKEFFDSLPPEERILTQSGFDARAEELGKPELLKTRIALMRQAEAIIEEVNKTIDEIRKNPEFPVGLAARRIKELRDNYSTVLQGIQGQLDIINQQLDDVNNQLNTEFRIAERVQEMRLAQEEEAKKEREEENKRRAQQNAIVLFQQGERNPGKIFNRIRAAGFDVEFDEINDIVRAMKDAEKKPDRFDFFSLQGGLLQIEKNPDGSEKSRRWIVPPRSTATTETEKTVPFSISAAKAGLVGLTQSQAADVLNPNITEPPLWFRQGMEQQLQQSITPEALREMWRDAQMLAQGEKVTKTGKEDINFEDF